MKKITFILFIFSSVCHSQIINFPDSNFKNALLNHNPVIDLNEDGEIQVSEAEIVIEISISFEPIASLEGIQFFTALEKLWYSQNYQNPVYITEIDLTNNINLNLIALVGNRLEFIDLSNNINLEQLFLNGNSLNSIDLSHNINLKILELYNMVQYGGPGISELDLSANFNLQEVGVGNSNLSFLNIKNGNNINIEDLDARMNPLLSCIQVDDENYIYPECIFAGDHMDGWCIEIYTILKEDCLLNIDIIDIQQSAIYPNPARDILKINSNYDLKRAQIFNTLGQKVFSEENLNTNEINVSFLSKGVYFLKLTGVKNNGVIKKFIKE